MDIDRNHVSIRVGYQYNEVNYAIDVMLLYRNRTLIKFLAKMYVQYHSTWYTVLYVLYVTTYRGVSVDPALESPRKPRLIYF